MPNTNQVIDEGVLKGLRQQMAEILNGGPDADKPSPLSAKSSSSEPGITAISRGQDLGVRRVGLGPSAATPAETVLHGKFLPMPPRSLEETGLTESDAESLILKYLLHARTASGTDIAQQVALPFNVLEKQLSQMKQSRLVLYKSISALHDYVYELTEQGATLARRYSDQCTCSAKRR